jgi:hypothetical protein
MNGAISLLPPYAFMAWTGKNYLFISGKNNFATEMQRV